MIRNALVVGINQYPSLKDKLTRKAKHLTTPATDAEAVAQLLERYGEFKVQRLPSVNQDDKLLVNPRQGVKLEELKKAINDLFCPQTGQVPETAVLFFAGHGWRESGHGETEGYLVTSDARPTEELWGLSLKWLRQVLDESPVRQQIIWLDCCHSGELFNFAQEDLVEYHTGRDRCFIAASRDFEVAYAQAQGEHGVLSGALIKGLDPTLQPHKWITNYSLVHFVEEALKEAPQHPISKNFGGQINLTSTQSILSSICPYKGLAYFDFNNEDPKYFHGRELLTKQLVERVNQSNFLALLGASGSGKSSVVRAGLLHQLKLGKILPGSDRWKIYEPFTPGEHPLENLERVINVKTDQLQGLVKAAAADRVVLVIDQFEEAFTLCRNETERQQFFKCLLDAQQCLGNKLCIVLVMRADFQSKCVEQDYTGLGAKIDQNLVRIMSMSQKELREAIIKPAKLVGLEIERELVNQMITDVSGSSGDLPLLQYTLTELWEMQTLSRLTISDYTRLGGVRKALEKHATKVLKSLSKDDRSVAKQIFLSLTQLSEDETVEDTRRRINKDDLATTSQLKAQLENVIQKLVDAKLIIITELLEKQGDAVKRTTVIEIAHETLIRYWKLLRRWLKINRKALLIKQEIEDSARYWRYQGKTKDYLLPEKRLKKAKELSQKLTGELILSDLAQDFIRESIKYRRSTIIRVIGFGFIAPLVIVGLVGFITERNSRVRELWDTVDAAQAQKNSLGRNQALEKLVQAGESLANRDFTEYDLTGINLRNADLSSTNLKGAILRGADLRNANLNGSYFGKADLSGVKLDSAYLMGATFIDAYLGNSKLNSANLSNADLSGGDLNNADLSDANFSNAKLSETNLRHSILKGTNLQQANLSEADLGGANLENAKLVNANLKNSYFGETKISGANIANANLGNAKDLTNEQLKSALNWQQARYTKLITNRNNRQWKAVSVLAGNGWTKTNICFKKGSTLNIIAKGQWANGFYIRSSGTSYQPFYGADGQTTSDGQAVRNTWLLPTVNLGTLIGRMNNSNPFEVGSKYSQVVRQDACLDLAINDNSDLKDNLGALSVIINISIK